MVVRATTSTTAIAPFNILDVYTDSAAAYSLRKLRKAYSGSAIRVRRSSDNVEQDIGFDSQGHFDELSLVSFTGGFGKNLLSYSEEFDNVYWAKNGVTISPNATISPIGSNNADKLVENTANVLHFLDRPVPTAVTPNQVYTRSIYLKAAGRSWVVLNFYDGTVSNLTWFNLANGTIGTASPNTIAIITDEGNGWYRCSLTKTVTSTQIYIGTEMALSDGTSSYQGDGTSGIFVWGAQLELGSVATAYDYKRDTANTSAFVTTWYDQSGNARNATQAIAANQPRIVNAGAVDKVNGRAAPTYSSASAGLIVSSLTSSVFHVFSAANLVGASYAHDGISANPRPYWNRSSSAQEDAGNGSAIFPAATGFSVRSRLYPTGIAYINSVAKTNSVGQGVGVGVNGLTIGNRFSLTESAGGSIPELISYFTDQSSSRATIEANIMSYYGIN